MKTAPLTALVPSSQHPLQKSTGIEHLSHQLTLVEEGSLFEDLAQFSTSSSTSGGDVKDLTVPNVITHHHSLEPETFKASTPTTLSCNPPMSYPQLYPGVSKTSDQYPCSEDTPWLSRADGYPHTFPQKEFTQLPVSHLPPPTSHQQPYSQPFFRFSLSGMRAISPTTEWPAQFQHTSQPSPRLPLPHLHQQIPTTAGGDGFGGWSRNLALNSPNAYINRCV